LRGNLNPSRDPKKGYQATASEFLQLTIDSQNKVSNVPSGRVEIDPQSTQSVAEQIWEQGELWVSLNRASSWISKLLDQFKCTNKSIFAENLLHADGFT